MEQLDSKLEQDLKEQNIELTTSKEVNQEIKATLSSNKAHDHKSRSMELSRKGIVNWLTLLLLLLYENKSQTYENYSRYSCYWSTIIQINITSTSDITEKIKTHRGKKHLYHYII